MSNRVMRQGRVWNVKMPRWLNWRTGGLIFLILISISVLFLVFVLAGDNDTVLRNRLHGQMKDLSHLSTVEYKLSTVVKVINPRGVWGDEVLVYGACGRVVAGIDLSKLSKEDIQVNGSHIRITLPPADIFTVGLVLGNDMSDVPEYKLETSGRTVKMSSECAEAIIIWDVPGLLSRTPQLVTDAQEEALKAFRKTAKDSGVKIDAQKNAQESLEKWFNRLDFEAVEFEITTKIELPQE